MMRNLILLLFATAGGLTASGIVANIYRIVARKPQTRAETAVYYTIMSVAGPSVLIENATRSFRTKACSRLAYGFAVAITGYWSFMLGLVILVVYLG
jgi:hypothetical protein